MLHLTDNVKLLAPAYRRHRAGLPGNVASLVLKFRHGMQYFIMEIDNFLSKSLPIILP